MAIPTFDQPVLWKGAVAGLAAGLVASFAMDRFQAAITSLSSSDGGGGESATEKAADRVAEAVTGKPVPKKRKPLAGQSVHYALGAILGVAYGAAAEVRPEATAGTGAVFGLGVAALLDETLVPAAGLGEAPWNAPFSTHLYTGASHLVFGVAVEFTRRLVRNALF